MFGFPRPQEAPLRPNFPTHTPLAQLKAWLRSEADNGATCPVCEQHVQVYRRKINAGMARSLIEMYRAGGLGWIHVPTQVGARSREEGKLAYWGLVEEEKILRPDGGRAGYWRVTPLGELFLRNQCTLPKYARIYNGRVLSLDPREKVTIKDALGARFDYSELMMGI